MNCLKRNVSHITPLERQNSVTFEHLVSFCSVTIWCDVGTWMGEHVYKGISPLNHKFLEGRRLFLHLFVLSTARPPLACSFIHCFSEHLNNLC